MQLEAESEHSSLQRLRKEIDGWLHKVDNPNLAIFSSLIDELQRNSITEDNISNHEKILLYCFAVHQLETKQQDPISQYVAGWLSKLPSFAFAHYRRWKVSQHLVEKRSNKANSLLAPIPRRRAPRPRIINHVTMDSKQVTKAVLEAIDSVEQEMAKRPTEYMAICDKISRACRHIPLPCSIMELQRVKFSRLRCLAEIMCQHNQDPLLKSFYTSSIENYTTSERNIMSDLIASVMVQNERAKFERIQQIIDECAFANDFISSIFGAIELFCQHHPDNHYVGAYLHPDEAPEGVNKLQLLLDLCFLGRLDKFLFQRTNATLSFPREVILVYQSLLNSFTRRAVHDVPAFITKTLEEFTEHHTKLSFEPEECNSKDSSDLYDIKGDTIYFKGQYNEVLIAQLQSMADQNGMSSAKIIALERESHYGFKITAPSVDEVSAWEMILNMVVTPDMPPVLEL